MDDSSILVAAQRRVAASGRAACGSGLLGVLLKGRSWLRQVLAKHERKQSRLCTSNVSDTYTSMAHLSAKVSVAYITSASLLKNVAGLSDSCALSAPIEWKMA